VRCAKNKTAGREVACVLECRLAALARRPWRGGTVTNEKMPLEPNWWRRGEEITKTNVPP
jgi:hypothetical protein